MAKIVLIGIPLLLLPVTSGEVEVASADKDKYFNPAQELLNGCEGVTGTELALCIVDRFAMELQSKQNKYIARLKHRKETKQAYTQREVPVARSGKSEQLVSRRRTPPPTVMEPHISLTKFVPRTGTHREKTRRKDGNRKQKKFPHNWNQSRQRHHQTSQLTLDHLLRENFRSSRSRLRRIHKRT